MRLYSAGSINEEARLRLVERLFSGTGQTYDHMVDLCTGGIDRWWKKKILEKISDGPSRIMDQACGTGNLTFKIARKFPDCKVVGVELRDEYLNIAKRKNQMLRLNTLEFILGRAEDVLLEGPFDCITSSYLAKYGDLVTLTQNARKMLRKGGLFIMHDFTYPANDMMARIWELHFRVLQTVGSWTHPQWRTIFNELPALIRNTQWVIELVRCLKENAFFAISVQSLTFGTSAIVTARK